MAKYTLLQLTQSILSALNSDEVNSISDTTESMQVAECIKTSYVNMMGRYDLPEHNQFIQLESSLTPNQPTLMYKPDGVQRIEWIKYYDSNLLDSTNTQSSQFGSYSHDLNTDLVPRGWVTASSTTITMATGNQTFQVTSGLKIPIGDNAIASNGTTNTMYGTVVSYSGTTLVLNITSFVGSGTYSSWTIKENLMVGSPPGYLDIQIMLPEDFIQYTMGFNQTSTDVGQMTITTNDVSKGIPNTFTFRYKNNHQPQCCTIISNSYIIFDSYDNTQDSALQGSKTMCYAWVIPAIQMVDNFLINLDEQQFPLLLNEAKSLAFLELKHMEHPKAEKEVLRQLQSLQKFKHLANKPTPFEMLPNFGRRIGTGGYAIYRPSR